jgi:hypothetical protein
MHQSEEVWSYRLTALAASVVDLCLPLVRLFGSIQRDLLLGGTVA